MELHLHSNIGPILHILSRLRNVQMDKCTNGTNGVPGPAGKQKVLFSLTFIRYLCCVLVPVGSSGKDAKDGKNGQPGRGGPPGFYNCPMNIPVLI
jgi:hypothetical protein